MPQLELRVEHVERRHRHEVRIQGRPSPRTQGEHRDRGEDDGARDSGRDPHALGDGAARRARVRCPDCVPELRRRPQPGVRILRQGSRDGVGNLGRRVGSRVGERLWRRGEMGRDHRLRRGAGERREPGEHLVTHHRQGVQVRPRVDVPLPGRLLRRHVAGRAQRQTRVREPAAAARFGERPRHAEIREDRVAAQQQDVLGLDIAVDHPLGVRLRERVGDLVQDPHRVGDGQPAFARQPVPQRLPRHERHDVEQQVVSRAGRQDGEDVGMLQVRGELDLLLEPRGAHFARELGWEQLDDNLAVQRRLGREEQATHAAAAQLLLDPVRVAERGLEASQQVTHRPLR